MKTWFHRLSRRAGLRCAGSCLAVLMFAAAARGEAPAVEPFEKDAGFLASKVAQYRYRLKGSPEGAQRLSTMETAVAQLKSMVAQLREEAEAVGDKDHKLEYLKTMELGPKERTVDRVRRSYDAWQQEIGQDADALRQAIETHNRGKKTYKVPEEQGALDAYNAEKAALDDRQAALKARYEEREKEWRGQFEAAVAEYTKAQQEFGETQTKREQAAQQFSSQAQQYAATRGGVVSELEALDNEPAPAVSGVLTPFSPENVPIEKAGTVALTKPPVGPGNNTHALDQLRVVTASSRDAAGVDDQGQVVNPPAEPVAKQESGYVFDDGQGTGIADLPGVNTPASRPAEPVPLVVPPTPVAEANAPTAVKNSPTLQKFSQAQSDGFSKLDQLYQQRRELMQQGAKAAPEAWTQVVKEISETHAAVNMAGVELKLAEGSQFIDVTYFAKPQRKLSDLTLPPPPPPSVPKP